MGHRHIKRAAQQKQRLQSRPAFAAFQVPDGVEMQPGFRSQHHLAPAPALAMGAQNLPESLNKRNCHVAIVTKGTHKIIHTIMCFLLSVSFYVLFCVRTKQHASMKLKLLLINLDRSTSRLQAMSAQLQRLGLQWERMAGVDGRLLQTENDLERYGYSLALNRKIYPRDMIPGEVGCFSSHRLAWKRILDNGWDGAVVLEDDIILSPEFPKFVTALEKAAGRWEAVRLCAFRKILRPEPLDAGGRWKMGFFFKTPTYTGAQALTAGAAAKLHTATRVFGSPVDVALQWWWETGVRFKGLIPDYPVAPNPKMPTDTDEAGAPRQANPSRRMVRFTRAVKYNTMVCLKTAAWLLGNR